jgi:hypothetical protein
MAAALAVGMAGIVDPSVRFVFNTVARCTDSAPDLRQRMILGRDPPSYGTGGFALCICPARPGKYRAVKTKSCRAMVGRTICPFMV